MNYEISVIVPVYNNAKYIEKSIESIHKQTIPAREIIIINDGSTDDTSKVLEIILKRLPNIKIFNQAHKGLSAALNLGTQKAQGEFILSLDSDAFIEENWLAKAVPEFKDSKTGAVSGLIHVANEYNFWAKLAGYDLEYRYSIANHKFINHLSTCNTLYSKKVLLELGGFDESLEYAVDNDISFKIMKKGYRLVLLKEAHCWHYWKEDFNGYIGQRYKGAYYRMVFVSKHPRGKNGDIITTAWNIIQIPLTGLLLILFILGLFKPDLIYFILLILIIFIISYIKEIKYYLFVKKSLIGLLLPLTHILRNCVWLTGCARWSVDRLLRHKKI